MAQKTRSATASPHDEPGYAWGYLPHDLSRVVNALNLRLMKHLRPVELTIPQLRVMQFLQQVESTSIGGICELTLIEQSVVSRIVNQLEERGFAKRVRNAQNARRVDVSLTQVGQLVLQSVTPDALKIVDTSLEALSPQEQQQLVDFHRRIYERTMALEAALKSKARAAARKPRG